MTILPVLISLFLSATRTKNIINFDEKDLFFFSVHGVRKVRLNYAMAIWPVTGQVFQNTKWPAVLYSQ